MKRLTPDDLRGDIYRVLARYTPHALKLVHRDKLIAELADAMSPYVVLSFVIPGTMHGRVGEDGQEAARGHAKRNAQLLEAGYRDTVLALVKLAEVER